MTDWQLGIDFGTSFTVVAVAEEGQIEVIDVESDGRSRLPSAVFLTEDDDVLVGSQAQRQAVFDPARYEPTPKRSVGEGEIFLGDRVIAVSDLIAGVFRRVFKEACRQQGGTLPSAIRVTHPADWAETRMQVLRRAVAAAGLEHVEYIAEPVAAAARIAMSSTVPGQVIAVYDFGGGTFDAAVLRRTEDAFEVAGPPAGRDPLGGEDIDRRILDHVGTLMADDYPEEWKRLLNPTDVSWRRDAATLRSEIQQAKETLSQVTACQLWVAGIDQGVQLTRAELEQLIHDDIEATVQTLEQAITAAGTTPTDLAGIYLVGGSSRIPLVADTIWRRLGVQPIAQENPKSVVAQGAAGWKMVRPRRSDSDAGHGAGDWDQGTGNVAGSTSGGTGGTGGAGGVFRSRLALASAAALPGPPRPAGRCSASIVVDQAEGARVSVQVWPAPAQATTAALAEQLGRQHSAKDPGYREITVGYATTFGITGGIERRYEITGAQGATEERVERSVVAAGCSVVASVPAGQSALLDSVSLQQTGFDWNQYFGVALSVGTRAGSACYERIEITLTGTAQQVTATRVSSPSRMSATDRLNGQLNNLLTTRWGATLTSRSSGPIVGQAIGEVVVVRVPGQVPMVVAIGTTEIDGDLYEVTVWVPEAEQSAIAGLAQRVFLQQLPSPSWATSPS